MSSVERHLMQDPYPSRLSTQPQLLPRQDPVFYGKWDRTAPLTLEQTKHFDEHGFLVLENLFTKSEVDTFRVEMNRLLNASQSLDPDTLISEEDSEEIRSIFLIHEQSKLMRQLVCDERMAGIARYLLNDEVYIHQSRLNYKPGFKGREFYWHSDFETWHAEDGMPRMRALSMSVLLEPNSACNGPLMLIPGSHRTFVACVGETPEDHYQTSLKKQQVGVPDEKTLAELATRHGIEAPTGAPGTVVIFDCNTMHGSNGNITPFPRANAFFVFNAVSNRLVEPFYAQNPRPEFIASRKVKPIKAQLLSDLAPS